MKTNITPQELSSLKEDFIAGITQVLNDQKIHEEEYSRLVDIVNQSKHDIGDKDFTVKFEDLLHITRISDELSIRKDEIEKSARKLFHSLTPSNIFVSQEFFDAWIEVSENMFVRFDYMEDRLVVRELEEQPELIPGGTLE